MPFYPDEGRSKGAIGAWVIGLCVLAVLVGCTTENKHKWLSFFFDGVPAPGATNVTAVVYDENGRPLEKGSFASTNIAAPIKAVFTPHPPYEERKCTECHESRFSVKMKAPQGQVCFACHKELEKTFSPAKVTHQPVENGKCSSCDCTRE